MGDQGATAGNGPKLQGQQCRGGAEGHQCADCAGGAEAQPDFGRRQNSCFGRFLILANTNSKI